MMPRFEHAPRESLERLHPGYFPLVMATGILALGVRLERLSLVPEILCWLNALFLLAGAGRLLRQVQQLAQGGRAIPPAPRCGSNRQRHRFEDRT